MRYSSTYISRAGGVEVPSTLQSISPERPPAALESALSVMSASVLAEHCIEEMNNFRRGTTYHECYCLELFRRATLQGDQLAWEYLQQVFGETIRGWLRQHPSREVVYRLDSEENYVAQAFERFWQATAQNQKLEFRTVAAALQYLRVSLNSAILDTLRVNARRREVALPESDFPGEPIVEDSTDGSELWEMLKEMLHEGREQRLAYLLYHCGLKPREIVHYCPREFSDVCEIYRMRRNIIERLRRNAYRIRQQLVLP